MNHHASELGKMAKGKKKRITEAERERRRRQCAENNRRRAKGSKKGSPTQVPPQSL
jgi:hypothetical protein